MSAVQYFMRAYWSKHMYQRCALAEENRERERERERPPKAALQTAKGGRTGGVPGGGPGGVKGTGGFSQKSPYLMDFCDLFGCRGRILWHLDSRYLKQFCPEKGLQNILEQNGRNSNSRPLIGTIQKQFYLRQDCLFTAVYL